MSIVLHEHALDDTLELVMKRKLSISNYPFISRSVETYDNYTHEKTDTVYYFNERSVYYLCRSETAWQAASYKDTQKRSST